MDQDDSHLVWKNMDKVLLCETSIFQLQTIRRISPQGDSASFVALEAPDWVTIVPELDSGMPNRSFLLVRQYRHGTEKVGMEFPAGMVDPGEKPLAAAARELLEETGYDAENLVSIGAVNPNPAFMTNTTHTFLAQGLQKMTNQNLDHHEYLDVHIMDYTKLNADMGRDAYASAITVQAWYFYLKYIENRRF